MNNINSLTVYGIPNCDTVKKAITYLKSKAITFEFHDYKKQGITAAQLKKWIKQVGTETIVNKNSTTWKALTDTDKALAATDAGLISLLQANTSIIKRPIVERNNQLILIGFKKELYEEAFKDLYEKP